MKRKNVQPESTTSAAPERESVNMAPSEDLQIYYNDAYMREKERFNEIFGIIEPKEQPKETVYIQPDMKKYVSKKSYKRAVGFWAFAAICASAGVAVCLLKIFGVL